MKLVCGVCDETMAPSSQKRAVVIREHGVYQAQSFYCPNGGCPSKVPTKAYLVPDAPYVNAHGDARAYTDELIAILEDKDLKVLPHGGDCKCGMSTRELLSRQEGQP